MRKIIYIVAAMTLVAAIGLAGAGCGIGVEAKTGTIEVRVTDAPPEYEVTSIVVTIAEEGVEVHKAGDNGDDGGWIPISINTGTFDLLLIQGVEEVLAVEAVAVGKYTQIRMNIVKVEVTYLEDGVETIVEATLPSGQLKFVRPFEVVEGESTILLLDFDADKSLTVTGNGTIIFKPVVKLSIEQE